jgi:hypothetical protein
MKEWDLRNHIRIIQTEKPIITEHDDTGVRDEEERSGIAVRISYSKLGLPRVCVHMRTVMHCRPCCPSAWDLDRQSAFLCELSLGTSCGAWLLSNFFFFKLCRV